MRVSFPTIFLLGSTLTSTALACFTFDAFMIWDDKVGTPERLYRGQFNAALMDDKGNTICWLDAHIDNMYIPLTCTEGYTASFSLYFRTVEYTSPSQKNELLGTNPVGGTGDISTYHASC